MKTGIWKPLLYFVPVLLLAAYAAISLPSRSSSNYRLVVDKIEAKPSQNVGYDTDVVVYLNAQGRWPTAVTNLAAFPASGKAPNWGMSDQCDIFYQKNGVWKKYQWPPSAATVLYPAAIYDEQYGGFIRRYSLNLSAIPSNLRPLRCDIHVAFYRDVAKSWRGKEKPMKADVSADASIAVR